eukprot:9477779-Pyramimonas_sp.AAC.1
MKRPHWASERSRPPWAATKPLRAERSRSGRWVETRHMARYLYPAPLPGGWVTAWHNAARRVWETEPGRPARGRPGERGRPQPAVVVSR